MLVHNPPPPSVSVYHPAINSCRPLTRHTPAACTWPLLPNPPPTPGHMFSLEHTHEHTRASVSRTNIRYICNIHVTSSPPPHSSEELQLWSETRSLDVTSNCREVHLQPLYLPCDSKHLELVDWRTTTYFYVTAPTVFILHLLQLQFSYKRHV